MSRKLNVQLLLCLLIVPVVIGIGVHFLHGYQVSRNANTLLKQAERAEEQGEFSEAAEYLRRYIGFVPDDANARAKLGLTLLDKLVTSPKARIEAVLILEKVLQMDPQRSDIRRRVADSWMELAQYDRVRFQDAQEHLEILLKAAPQDGELLRLLGKCREGSGHYQEAADTYAQSIKYQKKQIESYERLARLLRQRLNSPADADQVMNDMVEANKTSEAYLVRARYQKETLNELQAAADDLEKARQLAPNQADVLLATAELAQAKGHFDEAREALQRGIRLYPQNAMMYRTLAFVELQAGQPKEAVTALRRGLKAVAQANELLPYLAELLILSGELQEAGQVVAQLRKEGVSPARLNYLDSILHIQKGEWLEASRLLEALRPQLTQLPELGLRVNLLLGQCYGQLGEPDRQLAAYRQAITLDPLSVTARYGLGSALLAAGKLDDALAEFRQMMAFRHAPAGGWTVLARVLVLRNLRTPGPQRDWAEVEKVLRVAEEATPEAFEVPILWAEALTAQGQYDAARRRLEEARAKKPQQIDLWVALAVVAGKQGQPEAALSVLDEAQRQLGDRVELRLARLSHLTERRGAATRQALADMEKALVLFSGNDRLRLLAGLVNAHNKLGDAREAERLLKQFEEQQPNNLGAKIRLFDLALLAGDDAGMQRLVGEIRGIEGEGGVLWRYCEASRLVHLARRGDAKQLAAARTRLTEVATRRPTWSRVAVLDAEIDELEGNPERAIENYQRAVELGDRQPHVVRHLIRLLFERGRYAEAKLTMQKLQEQLPVTGELGRMAALVSLQNQEPERALQLAQQAVADSKDYRDLLWLGHLQWSLGRKEAEATFRRALAQADNQPAAWVALVQYLAGTNRPKEAEAAIQQAQVKLAPADAPLALASCYEAVGNAGRAEEYYQVALKAKPADVNLLRGVAGFYLRLGQLAKAEPPLRKILDPQSKAPAASLAWARRGLAMALTAGQGPRSFDAALALVEENLKNGKGSVEDHRARALLLATRPGRRWEAIGILEELVSRQAGLTEEQFLLARLYEAEGDWPNAKKRMLNLLALKGEDPRYLAHYALGLLRKSEVDEAQLQLLKLEKLEPDSLRTQEVKARLLKAQGKDKDAVALLQHYAQGKDANLAVAGALLEDLGQPAAAEELYRKYVSAPKRPEDLLVLIHFLVRQGRLQEALDQCERAWQTCPVEVVATTSVAALRAGKPTASQFQRVEGWLKAALEKKPEVPVLLLTLADFRDLQGRYPDCESLYRQVLQRDKANVIALNNLAWLLALTNGQSPEAATLIEQALNQIGPQAELLDTRALVYLALGKTELAIKDLEQALAQGPSATRYLHLALAHHQAKNQSAAAAAYQKAKAAGLKADKVHPLERPAYQKLVSELDPK